MRFHRTSRRHSSGLARCQPLVRSLMFDTLEPRRLLAADPYLADNIATSRANQDGGPFKLLTHLVDLTPVLASGRNLDLDDEVRFLFGITADSPSGNGQTDRSVAGDWDADGYAEVGVVRNDGPGLRWLLDDGNREQNVEHNFFFGLANDRAVVENFSDSGRDDIAVVRANGAALEWFVHLHTGSYPSDSSTLPVSRQFRFGLATDTPIAGDFNGDNHTDIGVVRAAAPNLQWIIHYGNGSWPAAGSSDTLSADLVFNLGSVGQIPIIGDWDGDGDDNWGLITRAPNASGTGPLDSQINDWFLDRDSDGTLETTFQYGFKDDQFLAGLFNHAPVANPQSVSATEDTAKSIVLTGSDPDIVAGNIADIPQSLSYSIVTGPSHGSLSGSGANRTYNPAGNYFGPDSFTFRVNDGAVNSVTTATVTINVASVNDLPTASAGGPYNVAEGSTVALSGTGSDLESGVTLTWDLDGDGNFGETGAGALRGNETGASPTYSAVDGPAAITVTLRVADTNSGSTTSTAVVNVSNVAPTANAGGPYHSTYGSLLPLAGSASDPAGAADPLTFIWDFNGNGIFGETGPAATRGAETGTNPSFDATGLVAGSNYTVTLRVTDGDSGQGQSTATITIGAPAFISGQKWHDTNGNGVQDNGERGLNNWTIEFVSLATGQVAGSVTTADEDLNLDMTIDFATERGIFKSPPLPPGTYSVREVLQSGWQQTYPANNSHIVSVAEGEFFSGPKFGNRLNNFYVTAFTPTTTGFVAEFNRDLDASALNLYDQGNTLGVADVTVSGATRGVMQGSLVVDPGLRKVTFIKSGGPLLDDFYTVTLRSTTTGFKDTTGLLLDGNNDEVGGDPFQATFTRPVVPASAIVLTSPDFTRGYGQAVNLPANSSSGIPIAINSANNLRSVSFDLLYNPALLTVTGASAAAGISGSVSFTVTGPGAIHVAVSHTGALSASAGSQTLVQLTATVPATAPYASKHVLDLANVQAEDTTEAHQSLPTVDDDGIHVAAYFGDASGSQSYSAPDATLTQRLIVGTNSGLAAYQLADPYLIVDITGNGAIQSNDVTLIQRAIVGTPVTQVPLIPGLPIQGAGQTGGPDPIVSIPQDLTATVGDQIVVPVELLVTEPTGITLAGVDLAIAYDPTLLAPAAVTLGELMLGFGLSVNTATPGLIRISLSTASPLDLPHRSAGALVHITFDVLQASPAPAALNLLATAGSFRTALYDDLGRGLLLQPAPSNGSDDEVDGRVTIGPASQEVNAAAVDFVLENGH